MQAVSGGSLDAETDARVVRLLEEDAGRQGPSPRRDEKLKFLCLTAPSSLLFRGNWRAQAPTQTLPHAGEGFMRSSPLSGCHPFGRFFAL